MHICMFNLYIHVYWLVLVVVVVMKWNNNREKKLLEQFSALSLLLIFILNIDPNLNYAFDQFMNPHIIYICIYTCVVLGQIINYVHLYIYSFFY